MNLPETLKTAIVAAMPRCLALLDKNPVSATFGCLDRKYWHYRIVDFPSGMQQELVLPLAFAWKTEFPGNRYFGQERIADYLRGCFAFHTRATNPDGSLDDYFPHERAFGATAYALCALTEAAMLTGLSPASALPAMERSGRFLASYREAGKLSNHLAIASLALANLFTMTGQKRWREESDRLVTELAAQQHQEGWFKEYEGCDLGYQTVTIEFLARRHVQIPSDQAAGMLSKCVAFVREFAHPDGSLGGEYGSRNTYNFYPGGFAILSTAMPGAAEMLGFFVKGMDSGAANYLEDDGVFSHMLSSYVTLLRCNEIRVEAPTVPSDCEVPSVKLYDGAGMFVGCGGQTRVYGSLTKGGVLKVFRGESLICSDTGYVGKLASGQLFCQNKPGTSTGRVDGTEIRIAGQTCSYSEKRLSRVHMIGLRVLSLLFGFLPLYSHFIRKLMQKTIIYDQSALPLSYERHILVTRSGVTIRDRLALSPSDPVETLYRSSDCVNTHVITSNSFQLANLQPWEAIEIPTGAAEIVLDREYR